MKKKMLLSATTAKTVKLNFQNAVILITLAALCY